MTNVQLTKKGWSETIMKPHEFNSGEYFWARVGSNAEKRLYMRVYESVVDVLKPGITYANEQNFYDCTLVDTVKITVS